MNPDARMTSEVETHVDPDLPDASAVMASLCCVAAQYASKPSLELATLAANLARKLALPQYAESRLVSEVARRLVKQWEAIVSERYTAFATVVPASPAIH